MTDSYAVALLLSSELRLPNVEAAAIIGPAPAPEYINVELTSGGRAAKSKTMSESCLLGGLSALGNLIGRHWPIELLAEGRLGNRRHDLGLDAVARSSEARAAATAVGHRGHAGHRARRPGRHPPGCAGGPALRRQRDGRARRRDSGTGSAGPARRHRHGTDGRPGAGRGQYRRSAEAAGPADGPCRTGVAGKSSAQAPEVGSSGRGSGKRRKQTAAAHADHVRRRRCVVTNIDIPEVGKVAVQDRAAEDAGQSADKTGESI